jgi:erythromycin esterase
LAKVASAPDYAIARQCARVIYQACELSLAEGVENMTGKALPIRDRSMAINVRWLIEQAYPNQKIVLWAHNTHVGTSPLEGAIKMMGFHLREAYGDQMVVLGFASERGVIRARYKGNLTEVKLNSPRPYSVEALFAQTGLPRFVLDFRRVPSSGALGTWLSHPRKLRSPGAAYDPDDEFYYTSVLPATYDGIVFIAESSAAKPLK